MNNGGRTPRVASSGPTPVSYAGLDGLEVAGDRRGPGDGPAVLFLHGGGQTRHSWGGAARAVAERGSTAITIDARGHGGSGWSPTGDYRAVTQAGDVAAVIEQIGAPPVVVGASMGGLTALLLEGEVAPGATRGIVLVDVVPDVEPEGADRIRAFMAERAESGFADLEEVADAIAAYNPHRPRPTDLSGLRKNLRWRDGRWYWHWDPRFITRPDQDSNGFSDRERYLKAVEAITVPLMLVRGGASDLVSEAKAQAFLDRFPHVRHVAVEGAGHMVAGDRNDLFIEAVLDFLPGAT